VFSTENDELERICHDLHWSFSVPVTCLALVEAVARGVSHRDCFRPNRKAHDVRFEFPADFAGVVSLLEKLFDETTPTRVFVPLMPVHVDHALVRAAAEHLAASYGVDIVYYEDQPYAALSPTALQRETSGLAMAGSAPEEMATARNVREICDRLKPFIQDRDARRILSYRQAFGERFWTTS
jgi:hypothetical protein